MRIIIKCCYFERATLSDETTCSVTGLGAEQLKNFFRFHLFRTIIYSIIYLP